MSQGIDFKLDTIDVKWILLKSALVEKLQQKFIVDDYSPIIK